MSNLLQRTITGLIFGVVVIGSIVLGKYTFALLLLVISALGLKEFYKLALSEANKKYSNVALIFGALTSTTYIIVDLIITENIFDISIVGLFFFVILCFIIFSILDIFWNSKPHTGQVLVGLILIPISIIALWHYGYPSQKHFSFELPLALLILTWANDVGAYFSGKFLGKRKLFERISPNKTWAGFYGGIVLTTIIAFLLNNYLYEFANLESQFNIIKIIFLGFTISIFATFGDLYQSYTKRIYGVKDSGNLLPGHGGIWDRFDGFFFVIYGYLIFTFISSFLF